MRHLPTTTPGYTPFLWGWWTTLVRHLINPHPTLYTIYGKNAGYDMVTLAVRGLNGRSFGYTVNHLTIFRQMFNRQYWSVVSLHCSFSYTAHLSRPKVLCSQTSISKECNKTSSDFVLKDILFTYINSPLTTDLCVRYCHMTYSPIHFHL